MKIRPSVPWTILFLSLILSGPLSAQSKWDKPCGRPPEAKPRRIKGGEAFPPLPLPATPLRRTERKRNPSAPVLIGKVVWGKERTFRSDKGKAIRFHDWNNDPSDLKRLLESAQRRLGIRYRAVPLELGDFSFDPDEIAVLWVTGTRRVAFSPEVRLKIRDYLEKGGTLWGDACRGSIEFADAFRREIASIMPDRTLRPLAPDHPVFSCTQDMGGRAGYSEWTEDRPEGAPYLEGLNIGCRTAVFFCPYALSCAWDSGHIEEGCAQMLEESALDLGMNLLTYTLAYRPLGRYLSRPPEAAADEPEPSGFVFAQVRFQGEYNPDPGAFSNLLRRLSRSTNIKVALQHPFVSLDDPRLLDYPFLYMTGHGPFALSAGEGEGLKRFLLGGGFLLVDACCGDLQFDQSFRRTLASLYREDALQEIPLEDPIFASSERIVHVSYTPKVEATWPGLDRPHLEGLAENGSWRLVYSRFDLGCGWEGEDHPYRMGLDDEDSLRLAVNVIIYAMTH